jgi:predicted transcriptional regulator
VRIDRLKIKWRNENLRMELKMNILDYVNSNKNISITNLADYTNQEYLLVAAVVDELVDEGLIPSKSFVNNVSW